MEVLRKCVTRKIKWREDSTIRVGKRVTHQCAVITNERRKRGVICVNARKIFHHSSNDVLCIQFREARIVALEKSIQEREKIVAECRAENLKSVEELYVANRRCADLESM